jgi:queuine tRNA-ribosyltransferase
VLLTWNNVWYYQDLMRGLRQAIEEGRLEEHAAGLMEGWRRDGTPPG